MLFAGSMLGFTPLRDLRRELVYRVVERVTRTTPHAAPLRLERAFDIHGHRFRMRLDVHRKNQRLVYFSQPYYESRAADFLASNLRDGDTLVDVGANVGFFSLLASSLVGSGRVHAFEPFDVVRSLLDANLTLNASQNVVVHPYALSDSPGTSRYTENPFNEGGGGLVRGDKVKSDAGWIDTAEVESSLGRSLSFDVETKRLDDVFDRDTRSRIRVIKIDVEGHELAVLRGARETLEQQRPFLLLEWTRHGAEVMSLLHGLSYVLIDAITLAVLDERDTERRFDNVIALPSGSRLPKWSG